MLPRFETVARIRPVDLVAPGAVQVDETAPGAVVDHATPHPAPYAAVVAELAPDGRGALRLDLTGDGTRFAACLDHDRSRVHLEVTVGDATTRHRSRRSGTVAAPATELGLVLTGTHLAVLTREAGEWVVRARHDLRDRCDTRAEPWLASLRSGQRADPAGGGARRLRAGGFGQLGLRDVRLVTTAAGEPVRDGDRLLLTAASAGPGFFDTAHTSVWALDTGALDIRALDPHRSRLEHRGDLFFRRPGLPGVYGDHATHLVRDRDRWLVATSTWGDFDTHRNPRVAVTLADTDADVLTGRHVLDTRPLDLPTADLASVGVWDPHLARVDDRWLVGFVNATAFFRFHPALAAGPSLDDLTLLGAARDRVATEGTTLARLDDGWRVLASDGRDNPRRFRGRFPVFDLALDEVGALDAPYPTNIPWPTVVRDGDGWLLVTFDGTPAGGRLVGYGSHGDVLVMRSTAGT